MKLYELSVFQRFQFVGKHRGITFKVVSSLPSQVVYVDVATGKERIAKSNRVTYRADVVIDKEPRMVDLDAIADIIQQCYQEERTKAGRSAINRVWRKIRG